MRGRSVVAEHLAVIFALGARGMTSPEPCACAGFRLPSNSPKILEYGLPTMLSEHRMAAVRHTDDHFTRVVVGAAGR